jgi:phytoene synthase
VLSHCAAEVREHDPDRYLATLFAPADAREALFALYAFDHEIARVRRVVSEPMAGLVRLQWWREALDAITADQPPAHPVVEAVHARWDRFAPLRPRLEAAIDAREQELSAEPPADLAELEWRLAATELPQGLW